MDIFYAFLLFIFILSVIILYLTNTFDHWQKQNVPTMPDPVPGFGHVLPGITLRENFATLFQRIYNHSKSSMIGLYYLRQPALVLRDPELVKSVLHSNFASFHDNLLQVSERVDPVMFRDPFFTTDRDVWREGRTRIVSHLSNRKLKLISQIVQDICTKMSEYVDKKMIDGSFETGLKQFFLKCCGEIVANAAFAIQGNSFVEDPKERPFADLADMIYTPTLKNAFRQILLLYFPWVAKFFDIKILETKSQIFLKKTIGKIIAQRKEDKEVINDYLQFCIDANQDDINSILSDLLIFYDDVHETVSSTLASIFYHLSLNQEVQTKLRKHIKESIIEENKKVTYEALKNMDYLEQVIFEAMRLTTPVGILLKVCTKRIALIGSDGLKCRLKPGDIVFISTLGLHLDEKYWPNPHTFDPERFSQENQAERQKYAFLPFGEGPRMCVGVRLAIMLVKFISSSLLLKYAVGASSRTKLPLERDPTSIATYMKGDLWAKFNELKLDE